VTEEQLPTTLRALLARVDQGWWKFRYAAVQLPAGRMNEHLDETDPASWTRKQMLAHISAWHDLTSDRLDHLRTTGKTSEPPASDEAFNAQVARRAVGRTAGEVLEEMDMSFSRLRRHLERLTDAQLALHDGWAAQVVAGNTFDHYAEHLADLALPEPPEGDATPPG
jgi:DinB superfamily